MREREGVIVSHDEASDQKVKVLIADDHALIRDALRSILEHENDFIVIGAAGDGEETVSMTSQLHPDVVIIDIGMPKLNGIEATRRIKKEFPNTIVLVLTIYNDSEHILSILEAGASGYLTKKVISEDIPRAIRSVINGESILSEEIMHNLLQYALKFSLKPLKMIPDDKLTERETEILQLAAQGCPNKIIAERLELSLHTVKKYMMNIFCKLKANSRTEAVMNAQRAGLLYIDASKLEDEEEC
jgi:DNA-binding NarL/FixJ family response regulator